MARFTPSDSPPMKLGRICLQTVTKHSPPHCGYGARIWEQPILSSIRRASSTYGDSRCGTQPCPCKLWRPRRRRQHRSSSSLVLSCRPATHAVSENSLMARSEQGPAFVAKARVEPSSQPKGAPVNCPSRSSTATCSCTWKWTMNPSPTCALQASGTTETGMTW